MFPLSVFQTEILKKQTTVPVSSESRLSDAKGGIFGFRFHIGQSEAHTMGYIVGWGRGMRNGRTFPRIGIDPITAAVFLCLLITDRTGFCKILLLAAALHEVGHLLAARALKVSVSALRLGFLGARMEIGDGTLSYGAEWGIAAAGPLASFVCAGIAAPFRNASEFALRFCAVSLLLGLLNLLPIDTFDGGRMARCTVAKLFGQSASDAVCRVLSFCMLFSLWSLSVYLLLRAGSGISWLGFSMSLFGRFFEAENRQTAPISPKIFGAKQRKTEKNGEKRQKL